MARMRLGECRVTKRGQTYCRTRRGVRFVSGRRGFRGAMAGFFEDDLAFAGGYGQYGGRMREGECRRTRKGVKYCKHRGKVRFRRG